MNLIEQLGGYEAAKEKYKILSDSDMITIGPIEFSAKDYFEDELLEYHRQHNIFEVGDLVVYKHPIGVDRVVSVINEHLIPHFLWQIRHATPEEIKAGKRL